MYDSDTEMSCGWTPLTCRSWMSYLQGGARVARECTRVRLLGTREAQEGKGKGRIARCVRGQRDGGPLVIGLEVHVRAVGARLRLAVVLRRGHQIVLGLDVLLLGLLAPAHSVLILRMLSGRRHGASRGC